MRGGLRRDRRGVSALFDAILFFLILLAASAGLHISASRAMGRGAVEAASAREASLVAEIHACALSCTIGPLELGGSNGSFEGSVVEALRTLLTGNGSGGGPRELVSEVERVYALLTPEPYVFALGIGSKTGEELFISPHASSALSIPHPRWTSVAPLYLDGLDCS